MSDYEYHGLMARTWDLLRGDTSRWADRLFYRELIEKEGQPVLDIGCASGRLLLDYLQQGIDVEGVDNSPELLAICRTRAAALGLSPGVYLQPMQRLDLPRRYRVILIPSSSLQLLTEVGEAQETLERVRVHLSAGGVVAASIMELWSPGEALDGGWSLAAEAIHPQDARTYRRWSRSVFDPETSCESTEDRYEVLEGDLVVESEYHARSPATRSYTQAEARALFASAGFVDVTLFHEFTWEPALPDDRLFVVVARKPVG